MARSNPSLILKTGSPHTRREAVRLAFYAIMLSIISWSSIGLAQRGEACLSDVYIALDRSGSMAARVDDGTNRRRMDVAIDAISAISNQFQNTMDLGLAMFPAGGTECIVGRRPFVPVGAGNGPAFAEQLSRHRYTTGYTPLARAIVSYTRWLIDERLGPERQAIVLVTDGNESCGGDPAAAAADALRAGVRVYVVAIVPPDTGREAFDRIAANGGTGEAVAIDNFGQLQQALSRLLRTIGAERCNDFDDDCDGRIDEGLGEGERCHTGRPGVCATGVQMCADDGVECVPSTQASLEVCDGLDNDCDGRVDEAARGTGTQCNTGALGICDSGVNRCLAGEMVCVRRGQPSAERCDGDDNDCDGRIDEGDPGGGDECVTGDEGVCGAGRLTCSRGRLTCGAEQRPSVDLCDGVDNDCDGRTDEGEAFLGNRCNTNREGVCGAGQFICADGGLVCEASSGASFEVCDGLDNDCDGTVDEAFPEDGQSCGTGLPGVCAWATAQCVDGALACPFEEEVGKDTCDGTDDDCDGRIDEEVRNACGWCGHTPSEMCNGADEDCDGQIDEDATCPDELLCRFGRCIATCERNECPQGFQCVGDVCLTPCEVNGCPDGSACEDGECVDVCDAAQCAQNQLCSEGACVDLAICDDVLCPLGERCDSGTCRADPCADIQCGDEDFCREGACVPSCADVSCAAGEACYDGVCAPDGCTVLQCDDGFLCFDGRCERALCEGVECSDGDLCLRGRCEDSPCNGVSCPRGQMCAVRQETGQCVFIGVNQPSSDANHDMPDMERARSPFGEQVPSPVDVPQLSRDESDEAESVFEESGCDCDASGADGTPTPAVMLLLCMLGWRRYRLHLRRS